MNPNSTRQRLACSTCSKRKIRCDKNIPCANCVKRGRQRHCHRGDQQPSPTPEVLPSDRSASRSQQPGEAGHLVDVLAKRVGHLEIALTKALSSLERLTDQLSQESTRGDASISAQLPPATTPETSRDESSTPNSPGQAPADLEDATTILEFLAWGQSKNSDRNSTRKSRVSGSVEQVWRRRPSDEGVFSMVEKTQLGYVHDLLPPELQVRKILHYHCESLLWYDGTFHAGTFLHELDGFYGNASGSIYHMSVDLLWVALLLSILSSSVACASPTTISEWGYSTDEAANLSQSFFEAAVTCLNIGDYMSRPCLYSVQCIATLTLPAHLLGHSTRQSIMISSAIKIAQTLNLHRLNPETSGNLPLVVEHETRCRVWCQLATQDFFSTPFSESHTISVVLTKTEKPKNCHDSDMKILPDNIPTITSFSRFKYDIAILLPKLQDAMASSSTVYAKYEHVLHYDSAMRSIATTGRPPFLGPGPLDESWPKWIPWARRSLRISSAHKIIMLHRKFIGPSFTNPAFAFTRQTCIAAAKTILRCQKEEIDRHSPIIWIEHAFSVTACIILWLGLQYQPRNEEEWNTSHQEVVDAVQILAMAERSKIAQRGVTLLQALLKHTQAPTRHPHSATSRKRKRNSEEASARRRSNVQFDTVEFANDFLERERANERHKAFANKLSTGPEMVLNQLDSQGDEFLLNNYLDFGDETYNAEWMQTAFESPEFVNNLLSIA